MNYLLSYISSIIILSAAITTSDAQTMFQLPFERTVSHVDIELHHPTSISNVDMGLFSGEYLARGVFRITDDLQLGVELPVALWSFSHPSGPVGLPATESHQGIGNIQLLGNMTFDSSRAMMVSAAIGLPTASDDAIFNIFADPWHLNRYFPHTFSGILEGMLSHNAQGLVVGASGGMEFYSTSDTSIAFTNRSSDSVYNLDRTALYLTFSAGLAYENENISIGARYRLLYYTGDPGPYSATTNMVAAQLMFKSAGLHPTLTVEFPLDNEISDVISPIINLRISVPFPSRKKE